MDCPPAARPSAEAGGPQGRRAMEPGLAEASRAPQPLARLGRLGQAHRDRKVVGRGLRLPFGRLGHDSARHVNRRAA